MSEARSLLLRALSSGSMVSAPRRSLTRRALEQRAPQKTVFDRYLAFGWGAYVWRSLIIMVAIPVSLAAGYYALIASPTYNVESRLAVRPALDRPLVEAYVGESMFDLLPSPSAARSERNGKGVDDTSDGSSSSSSSKSGPQSTMKQGNQASQIATMAMGALGGATTSTEPFIVADFIKSQEIVENLDKDGWLRARFSSGDPDWLQALKPDATIEELWRHWRRAVTVSLDVTTNLIHVEVKAFTAEDALAISRALTAESEALVNRMAERARRDRMTGAEAQVKRAEDRYAKAEAALRQFRTDEGLIDPTQQAQGAMQQLLTLISARVSLDVQLRVASPGLDKNAPQLKRIREQIAALDQEIKKAKAALADAQGAPDAAVNFLSTYEQKETERQLATMLYQMALDNLEQTKLETERQANYLTVYAPPFLPSHPAAESLTTNLLPTFMLSLMFWGVFSLFVASSRDHMR